MTRPLIAFCVPIPSMTKMLLSANWCIQLHNLMLVTDRVYDTILYFDATLGYGIARNRLAHKALSPKGGRSADYIFWLDSDVELERDTVLKMMQQDYPITSAVYWSKTEKEYPIAYNFGETSSEPLKEIPAENFICDAVGLGACLMRATVFAALVQKCPDEIPMFDNNPFNQTKKVEGEFDKVIGGYNYFSTFVTKNGLLVGEDIYFFNLIKEYTKYKVHVMPSLKTRHTGEAEAVWDGESCERVMI